MRNAYARRLAHFDAPASRSLLALCECLKRRRLISGYYLLERSPSDRTVRVFLLYGPGAEPVVKGVRAISRPSAIRYVGFRELSSMGFYGGEYLLSTPRGWLSSRESLAAKTGGVLVAHFLRA